MEALRKTVLPRTARLDVQGLDVDETEIVEGEENPEGDDREAEEEGRGGPASERSTSGARAEPNPSSSSSRLSVAR